MNTTLDNPVINRIKQDIGENDVVLFMKGTPEFPQCGFSGRVVQILSQLGVTFKGINVLRSGELRQGIKDYQPSGRPSRSSTSRASSSAAATS